MRPPSIGRPRSIWDVLAVLAAYGLLEYIALQLTGSLLVRQELVVIGIVVVLWAVWATFRVLTVSEG